MQELKHSFILILSRFWERERPVLICFLLVLIVVVIYNFAKIDWFLNGIDLAILSIWEKSRFIYEIALSIFSGIIVYFLTVVVAESKRHRYMLVETECLVRNLIDSFVSFSLDMQLGEIDEINEFTQKGLTITKNHGMETETLFSLSYCSKYLVRLANDFESLTSSILRDSNILSQNELALLIQIRQSDVISKLRNHYGMDHLLSESEICDFFKEISIVYKRICDLHTIINKRIYKQ